MREIEGALSSLVANASFLGRKITTLREAHHLTCQDLADRCGCDVTVIEKLEAEAGQEIVFDQVLAILDGDKATFGTPVVEGASVEGKIVKNGKGKKIRIFKYNAKKGYRKRQGHRQPYTKVEIGKISI